MAEDEPVIADAAPTVEGPQKPEGKIGMFTFPMMFAGEVGALVYHGKTKENRMVEYVQKEAPQGDGAKTVEAIDKFCTDNWMMNFGDVKGKQMDEAIQTHGIHKIKTAIEFGGYIGYATLRLANLLPSTVKMYSVESTQRYADAQKAVMDHGGAGDRCEQYVGYSGDFIKKMIADDIKVDLLFIDHQLTVYTEDVVMLMKHGLLNPGCLIICDNVLFPGAPDHKKWTFEQEGVLFKSRIIETHVDIPGYADGDKNNIVPDELLVSEYIGYDKTLVFVKEEIINKLK